MIWFELQIYTNTVSPHKKEHKSSSAMNNWDSILAQHTTQHTGRLKNEVMKKMQLFCPL
jgi:hypothetical protein